MRPYALLAATLLLTISGCEDADEVGVGVDAGVGPSGATDSGIPEGPRSSLAACDSFEGCMSVAERCYVSQECPLPGPPGTPPGTCAPETGDHLCHRLCGAENPCGAGERCITVYIAMRSDYSRPFSLCFH